MRLASVVVGVALVMLSSVALAQPTPMPPQPESEPVALLAPVDTTVPPPIDPPVETPPDVQEIAPDPIISDPDASVIQSIAQRVGFNVFGDASFAARSAGKPHSSFELGAIGLIMNAEFSETLSAVNEVAFEFAPDGLGGAGPVADVERLLIQYNSKHVHVAAGRLHSELGYWNTAFHHGRWLQLPIERPRAVQFEDDNGILPIHMVGLEAAYTATSPTGSLRFLGAVGNGRGNIEDDIRTLEDTNEMKSILVKVESTDYGHRDLKLGMSAQIDQIAPAARGQHPTRSINELIANGYLAYRGTDLLVIAEAYTVVHDDHDARFTTLAGFALAGWDFGRYVPYAQLEVRHAASGVDPFYSPAFSAATPDPAATSELAADLVEMSVGNRVELSEWSVLKFQATVARSGGTTDLTGVANWSFGI
jgi:hypothetical protein